MLALEDLKDFSEHQVLKHLAENYSGDKSGFDYGDICEADIEKANDLLKNMEVLVAYQSVGSWGCDSSAFFLLKDKTDGKMFEVHGSHCSCFGFEGQLQLEETTIEALKFRINNAKYLFSTGGYDNNDSENKQKVSDLVLSL